MNVIDTNIWIYSYDPRDPLKQIVAKNLIMTVGPLVLPWQVGCEFLAASRKLAPLGFDEAKAWSALAAMQAMAKVVLMPHPNSGPPRIRSGGAIRFRSGTLCWSQRALTAVYRFFSPRTWARPVKSTVYHWSIRF